MAELDERERINQELREQVHQELDIARGLIYYTPGLEGLKKVHTKLESIVIDRSKRLVIFVLFLKFLVRSKYFMIWFLLFCAMDL